MEQWVSIHGHASYEVSNKGNVRLAKSKKPIKPWKSSGYYYVALSADDRRVRVAVHRLVAQSFILNPENKPCVNHIDGNKLNNNYENLEWVTYGENHQHAWDIGLRSMTDKMKEALVQSREKPVLCSNGKTYRSSAHAAKALGLSAQGICNVLKGRNKSTGGYSFEYAEPHGRD